MNDFYSFVVGSMGISFIIIPIGAIITIISWIIDSGKLEKIGIYILLAGVICWLLSISSCTIGILRSFN